MGVNPTTFARGDDRHALGGDIEGGDRQEKPEAGEGTNRANLRFLEIPSVGLVIEKRLLNVKAQAVFLEGVKVSGLIADDGPKLTIDVVVAKGDMHRAVPLPFMELHGVPTERLPPAKVNILQLAPAMPDSPNPTIPLDADAVVPSQLRRHRRHGVGVDEAPVGQQHHRHPRRQSLRRLMEHLPIGLIGD